MNLYLRLFKILWNALFLRRHDGLFDAARVTFRAWPTDCDINLHVNNGRYLSFMDLGRLNLLARLGLLGTILRRHWQPVLMAVEVSFIRPINPFQLFVLETQLITWDEKYFYIEQRFSRDNVLCALATVKGLFLARGERLTPRQVLAAVGIQTEAPPLSALLRHWNDLGALKKENSSVR